MRGVNESYYKFKVTDPEGKIHYIKMINEALEIWGIPKPSFYLIIKKKSNGKWKNFQIDKVKINVYEKIKDQNYIN